MNVALVGEFSGVHRAIRDGLRALGHQASVYSAGDGFKHIDGDAWWGPRDGSYAALAQWLLVGQPALLRQLLLQHDVVQFVSPEALIAPNHARRPYVRWLLSTMPPARALVSLLVAGCEHNVHKAFERATLQPCPGCVREDFTSGCPFGSRGHQQATAAIEGFADVIVPMSLRAYRDAYAPSSKLADVLPLPSPVPCELAPANRVDGRVRVLHGLNRPGFKGSGIIYGVLERLRHQMPGRIEVITPGRLSFDSYLGVLREAHVVVDQLHADGFGINAVLALGAGKVLVTSYDEEWNRALYGEDIPAIDARDSASLESALRAILGWPDDQFADVGATAAAFAHRHFSARTVAARLVSAWESRTLSRPR